MPRPLRKLLPLAVSVLMAAGCTQYVETPDTDLRGIAPVARSDQSAVLKRIIPTPAYGATERISLPSARRSVQQPQVGEVMAFDIVVTPELKNLWQATGDKDWAYWDAALAAAEQSLPDTPEAEFILSSQRIKTMIHAGRPEEVFKELKHFAELEEAMFGDNIETLSQYGQVNFWLNKPDIAIGYYSRVLKEAGDWWIPTFYYAKPENIGNAKRLAGAMLRSDIGMSGALVMKHDYPAAMAWGEQGVKHAQDIIGISHHPIYGMFVETTSYMYEGHAWSLTFYVAARIGVSKDVAANQHLIDSAKDFFRQSGYRWGDIVVDSVVDYVLYDIGLKPQQTNAIGVIGDPELATAERLAAALKIRPKDLIFRESLELPIPNEKTIRLPGEGEINSYDYKVTPALARANAAYLDGEYATAYEIYTDISATAEDPLQKWHAKNEAVKALIAAGRSAKALSTLAELEPLEIAYFGTNLNVRSLRGEAKFWLGDHDGALADFVQVAEALGDFRAPTLFVFPPQIPHLALLNRAQFRTNLGIARSLMYQGNYKDALPWAEAAEQLFEEAHYAWQHQLYSAYLKIDAEMFYGRGANQAVIGAAHIVSGQDDARSDEIFGAAKAYLNALGFTTGLTIVDSIRARALLDADRPTEAAAIAKEAAKFAAENGQADLLWQVEALRGEALARLGRHEDAEKALRAAQTAIDAVSGALATDSSKRRFGLGKEEITNLLVTYDLERSDHAAAFADLERGRARAFVDMIGNVRVASAQQSDLVNIIRGFDQKIRAARVRAATPGTSSANTNNATAKLLSQRGRAIRSLRARDPELASALSIDTHTLSQIQRKLGPKDLMVYALPSERTKDTPIRFLAISRKGTKIIETTLSQYDLGAALTPFTSDRPLEDAGIQAQAVSRISSDLKLADWTPQGTLYVVPTGSLYFMPWGALPIETPVVVLPTGGWLVRSLAASGRRGAAIVGDPYLGEDWPELPGARVEAEDIADLYNVEALTGSDATMDALRLKVGKGVRVLHLATHGMFNGRDPLKSSILMSGSNTSERVTAADLFENPIPADLVIMSACETGLGYVAAGDDFLGLSRSFYLGGARAVMNSLWPVHDKPTQAFMAVFHRAMADNGDIGTAWLKARNHLREQGFPPAVYGAFVLGGAARI